MRPALLLACAATLTASALSAQTPRVFTLRSDANRAVLGVTLASPDVADSLGLRVEAVTDSGPAARAGLRAGQRIVAINGTSLAVSGVDARDPATRDAGYRRLLRVLEDVTPGDTVSLRLLDGTASRTVRVATTTMRELTRLRMGDAELRASTLLGSRLTDATSRPALGLTLGATPSARDTLGVFVAGVTAGGPAEKAGVIEGARIASINGVDVRVPREDAGVDEASANRVSRFTRTLRELAPGATVSLRVWSEGRWRDVQVTAVAASELPGSRFEFRSGDGVGVLRFGGPEGWPGPALAPRLDRERLERELQGLRLERLEGLDGMREFRIERPDGMREFRIERPTTDGSRVRIRTAPAPGGLRPMAPARPGATGRVVRRIVL